MSDEQLSGFDLHYQQKNVLADKIDPCNNWNDCGKLINELNTSNAILKIVEDEVYYDIGSDSYFVVSDNLMRAVTIIYILANQGK